MSEHYVLNKFGGVEVKLCKFNLTLDGVIYLFPALYLRAEGHRYTLDERHCRGSDFLTLKHK
jgi:hypothetical protein